MISVDRKKVKKPTVLCGQNNLGYLEAQKWIDYHENNIKPKPSFSVYKTKEIKDTLEKLFNNKCAYCEREIKDVTWGNVEHFRPKGRIVDVDNNKITKGYYWLAASWENLLLSCDNCNTIHHVEDNNGNKISVGKGDKFPLMKGTSHSTRKQNIYREENKRLLINPTKDNPNEFLIYDVKTGAVKAKGTDRLKKERGEKTIEIFGLNLKTCHEKRQTAALTFWKRIEFIKEEAKLHDLISSKNVAAKKLAKKRIFDEINEIKNLINNVKTENLGFLKLALTAAKKDLRNLSRR